MSAGMNVARPATPIDLETMRRYLREVMTNLRLLENGENVRVEDLIRQARENLDRNRRFILRVGQNQGNRNVGNNIRVVPNQVERNPVIHPAPRAAEEEEQPVRENTENNAVEQADGNQRDNEQQNVLGNDENPVRHMANRVREWAERYERDWVQFRENRQIDGLIGGHAVQNMQINNPVQRNVPTLLHIRAPGGAANIAGPVGINRNNDNNVARARPANYELPRCLLGAIRRRPAHIPEGPNIYPLAGGPMRYNNYPPHMRLGVVPPPLRRPAPYPRPIVPNQHGTLEERIAFLQDRLDRLEDGRFYEYMIEEGGHERIRDMIRRLRRQMRDNVANANANLAANNGLNRLNVEANQDHADQTILPPPNRDIPQCFTPRAPQLAPRAPEQTINQHNLTLKRQNVAGSSGETNAKPVSTPKRLKLENNLPGKSSDPGKLPSRNSSDSAGPSNRRRNSLDAGPDSAQNLSKNIPSTFKRLTIPLVALPETDVTPQEIIEIPEKTKDKCKHSKKHKNKDHSKKDRHKHKHRPEKKTDHQRPSTSRENSDFQIIRDDEGNDREDNDIIDRPILEDPAENIPAPENIHDENEENPQDPNADVIIVSAFFPVPIKVERNNDDYNDNRPNNVPNQGNAAQNRANPPVIPQNDNGARQEPGRVVRLGGAPRMMENLIERALRQLPIPNLPPGALRGVEGAIIEIPEPAIGPNGNEAGGMARVLNYIRARRLNANAEASGPDILGILNLPFLTLENIIMGLQTFITSEVREGNRRTAQVLVQANENEENQLLMIQTYVRLRRELREVIFDSERLGMQGCKLSCLNDQILLWFTIVGPPGTAYDRAKISIRIKVNMSQWGHYSEVRMAQRTWHPNMCPFTGDILPVFPWNNWTLFKILACIRRLLIIPELENTTHDIVAKQYQTNREVFNRTAQHWTSVYGRGGRNDDLALPEYTELLERLVEEGIPKDRALHLLSKNDWDIDKAMEEIG